ncbi:MAG: cupin domain-containing protein [Anaerolineae bacterium]
MTVINIRDMPQRTIGPVTYHIVSAEPVMMLHLIIPANTNLPEHEHENFQMGYVLSGSGSLAIGSEQTPVSQGMAYIIPEHVPHSLQTGDEPLELLDIYYPPKDDRL